MELLGAGMVTLHRRGSKKIGELAQRAGLNASAVRYGGQRRYSPDGVDRVLLLRFTSEMGFSLAEIELFLGGLGDHTPPGPRWKKLATRKLSEVEDRIARFLRLKTLLQSTPLPLRFSQAMRRRAWPQRRPPLCFRAGLMRRPINLLCGCAETRIVAK